jgi:hypothetical protein
MTIRRHFITALSLALLPAIGFAQARGGGGGRAVAAAPHVSAHAAPAMSVHAAVAPHVTASGVRVVPGARWVRTRSGALVLRPSPRPAQPIRSVSANRPLLSQDNVPGLGFDYAHLAAVHPGRDGRDRGRFRNRNFVGAFVPFFYGGGYYMPLFPDDTEDVAPEAQPDEYAQAGPPPDGYYDDRPRESAPVYGPPAEPAAPEHQSDEYVFVRRDGTVFFAVGYTWQNGTLRYITSEGLRHTVDGSSLDLVATQQFNEQRGLSFHLPA